MREKALRRDSMLLSCVLIRDWLREEALRQEALVVILRPNLFLVAEKNTTKRKHWLLFCVLISDRMREDPLEKKEAYVALFCLNS
jgi:hypothetical protein